MRITSHILVILIFLQTNLSASENNCVRFWTPYNEILEKYEAYYKTDLLKPRKWFETYSNFIRTLHKEIVNIPDIDEVSLKKVSTIALKYTIAPFLPRKNDLYFIERDEMMLLKKYPILKSTYTISLMANDILTRYPLKLSMNMARFFSGPQTLAPFAYENNQSLSPIGADIAYKMMNILLPIPLNLASKDRMVFIKQWYNPKYTPNEVERKILVSKNMLTLFEQRGEYYQAFPVWQRIKQTHQIIMAVIVAGFWAMGINYYLELKENHKAYDDIKDNEEYKKGVRIIIDEAPLPHLALQVDNTVYSYGVEQMHTSLLYEYLGAREIHDMLKKNGYVKEEETNSSTKFFEKINPPHSAVVIELNISEEQKSQIIRHLELQNGKNYDNQTGINDCVTMISRVLNQYTSIYIPPLIDASPNMIGQYLAWEHKSGDNKVKSIYQVATQKQEDVVFHSERNTFIAMLESKIFLKNILPFFAARTYFEQTHSEENIQWWNDTKLREIESWREDLRIDLEKERNYSNVQKLMDIYEGKEKLEPEEVNTLNKYVEILNKRLDEKQEKAKQSLDINVRHDLFSLVRTQEEIEIIQKQKEKINARKNKVLGDKK
mgnify:CR=1 FL=1